MSFYAYVGERLGAMLLVAAALSAATRWLPRRWRMPSLTALVAVAILVPVGDGLTAVDYVFSAVGPLSAASFVFAGTAAFGNTGMRAAPLHAGMPAMAAAAVLLAVLLYPPAFGIGPVDVYGLGYRGWALPGLLLAILAAGAVFRATAIALWVALAAILFVLHVGPSRNLWDFVIDPVAAIWATAVLVVWAAGALRAMSGRRRSAGTVGTGTGPPDATDYRPAAEA